MDFVDRDADNKNCAGFWHFNSKNYSKEYAIVRFVFGGIQCDTIDEHDFIIWSVLNGDSDELVKFLMEEWNAENILKDAFAVLIPHKAGIWKHICLEIPKYYYGERRGDFDLDFQKNRECQGEKY